MVNIMTDALVTVACMCASIVAVACIVAVSHNRLTASMQATWNGKSASVVIAPASPAIPTRAGEGGFGPLTWMPLWKQTGGLLPDGQMDPQADNDCGETCVAMVGATMRGVAIAPGDIRQQLGGVRRIGLTSPEDLMQAVAINHVRSHVERPNSQNGWMLNAACYGQDKPAIVLGYWLNMSCMHWMLLIDKVPARFTFVDPWTGECRQLTLQQWMAAYCSATVVVDDHPLYDVHTWLTPGTGAEA